MSISLTKCPFCQGYVTNWTLDNLVKLSRVNSGSNLCSLSFHKLRRHLMTCLFKPLVINLVKRLNDKTMAVKINAAA